MNNNLKIPSFDELMQPAINALVSLGGSGSIAEIYEEVLELEGFSDEVTTVLHNPEKSSQTAVSYRLAWARTYLKKQVTWITLLGAYGFLQIRQRKTVLMFQKKHWSGESKYTKYLLSK